MESSVFSDTRLKDFWLLYHGMIIFSFLILILMLNLFHFLICILIRQIIDASILSGFDLFYFMLKMIDSPSIDVIIKHHKVSLSFFFIIFNLKSCSWILNALLSKIFSSLLFLSKLRDLFNDSTLTYLRSMLQWNFFLLILKNIRVNLKIVVNIVVIESRAFMILFIESLNNFLTFLLYFFSLFNA